MSVDLRPRTYGPQPPVDPEDFFGRVLPELLDARAAAVLPGAVTFRDRASGPLDLQRAFRVDDPIEELRHFLVEAGYLHIAGVFTADEMAAVSRDMDAAAPGYAPGDGKSWWAKTSDGERRL